MKNVNQFTKFLTTFANKEQDEKLITNFNKLMDSIEKNTSIGTEDYLMSFLTQIQDDYSKIEKKAFVWDKSHAINIQKFMNKISNLSGELYLEFANSKFLTDNITCSTIFAYCNVNYGEVGKSSLYSETIRALTHLLSFFIHSHLRKTLIYSPKISTQTFFLLDPLFRQQIRNFNRQNEKIKWLFFSDQFDLKKFALKCIRQFFPNVNWGWIESKHHCHYFTLKIVLEMFEYGLWEFIDLDKIWNEIYNIVNIMKNLEDNIKKKNQNVNSNYLIECKNYCTKIRELIASILIHLIIMDFDKKFHYKIQQLGYDRVHSFHHKFLDIKPTFFESFLFWNSYYHYYLHIIISYLSKYESFFKNEQIYSETLQQLLYYLYAYLVDINDDYCYISLKMLEEENLHFYFLWKKTFFITQVEQFQQSFELFVYDIKTLKDSDKVDDDVYLFNFNSIIKRLKDFLAQNNNNDKNLKTIQLLLTLHNIPQYIFSYLHLLTNSQEQTTQQIMKSAISVIVDICTDNYMAQNMIFSKPCFTHFKAIFLKHYKQMLPFLKVVIGKKGSCQLIERNPEIFNIIQKVYKIMVTEFLSFIHDFNKNQNYSIYFFNRILSEMLIFFSDKSSLFNFLITNILEPLIPHILQYLKEKQINLEVEDDYFQIIHSNMDKMLDIEDSLDTLDDNHRQLTTYELLFSFLNLYNKATKRFYTSQSLLMMNTKIKTIQIDEFLHLLNFRGGIFILKEILKLYSNFKIFPEDNLLKNKNIKKLNRKDKNKIFQPIEKEMFDQGFLDKLLLVGEQIKEKMDDGYINRAEMVSFMFCAYFPCLFKLFNGILSLFITEISPYKIEFMNFMSWIREFNLIIENLKDEIDGYAFIQRPKLDKQSFKYQNVEKVEEYFKDYFKIADDKNHVFFNPFENVKLKFLRENGYYFILSIINLYKNYPTKLLHLKEFTRFYFKTSDEELFQHQYSVLKFNFSFRLANKQNIKKTEKLIKKNKENKTFINQIINYYEKEKIWFWKNPSHNELFLISESQDTLDNNMIICINYFFTELSKFDLSLEVNDPNTHILSNNKFIFFIIFIDNFIKSSVSFRRTFFSILVGLQELQNPNLDALQIFKKLWILHRNLYYYCITRPYLNKAWIILETIYYLISHFIQNLCENNSFWFKQWFHKTDIEGRSMFSDYYQMFINSFMISQLFVNQYPQIVLSDKIELFKLIIRVTNGTTEFINGGLIQTNAEQYSKEIPFLIQILLRNVYEVNSPFYYIQNVITNFFIGLMESKYEEIIKIFKRNLPINKLFKQIVFIIKLLHYNQTLLLQQGQEGKDIVINEEKFFSYKIKSTQEILDYYFRYKKTFSHHISLKVAINIYHILLEISQQVVKYKNFFLDQNKMVEKYNNQKLKSGKNMEEIYIWDFLNKIFIQIEIVDHIKNKSYFVKQKTKNSYKKTFFSQKTLTFDDKSDNSKKVKQNDNNSNYKMKLKKQLKKDETQEIQNDTIQQDKSDKINQSKSDNQNEKIEIIEKSDVIKEQKPKSKKDISPRKKVSTNSKMFSHTSGNQKKKKNTKKKVQIQSFLNKKKQNPLKMFYFQKYPECFFLNEPIKKNFMQQTRISSTDEKHEEFFSNYNIFLIQMKSKMKFYSETAFFFKYSYKLVNESKSFLYFLVFAINLILLLLDYESSKEMKDFSTISNLLILILALVNLIISLIMIYFWFWIEYPPYLEINLDKYYQSRPSKDKPSLSQRFNIYIYQSLILNQDFQYLFLNIIFMILGIAKSMAFFIIALLLVIYLSNLIQNVVLSFLSNYDKLFFTFLILVIFINCFSHLLSDFFRNDFQKSNIGDKYMYTCDSYMGCFFNTLNLGVKTHGGISDYLYYNEDLKDNQFFARFSFDLLYYIFINLILTGIVFGVIVQSFAKLRDDMNKRQQDKKNVCFTCGLTRNEIEKRGIGFNDHINFHDIWNYLFYIIYLKNKSVHSYQGIDIVIIRYIEDNYNDDWMPRKRTTLLEKESAQF